MTDPDPNPTALNPPLGKSTKVIFGGLCGLVVLMVMIGHSTSDSTPSTDAPVEKPIVPAQSKPGRYEMTGTLVRFNDSALACGRLEDFKKIIELDREGDGAAIDAMIDSGRCQLLDEGTTGTVQDSSLWSKAECIRLPGDVDCLWAPVARTERASAKF